MSKAREDIAGVVIPLPTPFTERLDVDHDALSRYVGWLIDHGIRTVMTTVGTSRFNLLTAEEVKAVNETVVKAADGRALTIVANPPFGGTRQAIEFARHAEAVGADYFLAYFPDRYYGDENTCRYFEALAEAVERIEILIHEMPLRSGLGGAQVPYSESVLKRLLSAEKIVGLKEEALDAEHSNHLVEAFSSTAIIIGAGGGMSRYLERDFDRGAKAYLGGIGGFVPQVELDFFDHLVAGRRGQAEEIVQTLEKPFFKGVVPIGWHPALKAAIAAKDLLPTFERPPMKTLSSDECAQVKALLETRVWL